MEKAEKLRSAQSFPLLCNSPRSSSEHRAVPLRKSVSVSELVARYQSILDHEGSMSKQEYPKLMERRYLAQSNVSPMGKKHTLSQIHSSDVTWSKSMQDLPIHKTSPTTRNLNGRLTSLNTPKATPQSKTLPLAPLKTSSLHSILKNREADTRIMTTIQPLSRNTKLHKEPSSSLQSIQRKAQWSPAIITWKDSAAKEGRISHDRQTIISSVTETANDSAMGRSDERTRSFLDISDSTRRLLQQGRGRSSSLSVKELSARYLSQAAAAAAASSQGSTTSPRTVKDSSTQSLNSQKTSKMAEPQKSSKVAIKKMEDDLPPPPIPGSVQIIAPGSQDPNPLPVPPPKQAFSKFYQQRQVNELKRLYRHMHPELRKNLEEAVTEDLAEMLNAEDPNAQGSVNLDKVLPGEVQSMRWIFENWALDSIGDHQATKKMMEDEIIPGGDVKSTSLRFENQSVNGDYLSTTAKVSETDLARGDVHTARWLFETQPLDSLNKLYSDETEVQEAVLKELVQGGDVKGAKELFEAQSLDAIGRCCSVEEKSILQLKSEIQELKGDVKKTIRLFQTEPLCAIRDKTGNIHEIKSVCREEIQSNAVRTARWLFETQPLDTINKDTSKVQIIRGISLKEIGRPDVSGARWIFETQPLDAIREITVEEQDFKASTDFVTGADVSKQRLLFETQALDSLKGEASESVAAKEQVIGGDVKSTLWLFETQPMETLKDNFEVGHLKKVELSAEEKGDVKQRKHVFETCPLGSISKAFEEEISAASTEEVVKGDVKSFKTLFETLPLDSIKEVDAEPVTKEEEKIPPGNVKANQILFETTPLYAIKDSFGNFHEVTSVSREQVISGDVKKYKWMFETRPLDQFDESTKKVDIIRGITKQEVVAGDVRTAKWLFETQPMDVIHHQATQGEEHPSVKREISQRGDVKTCRWLFETQPMHTLYEKAEKKQEEDVSVPQADVKSYTWMFETQPLDSLKGQEEQYLRVSKAYSQDELQGVDVKTVRHLFETEPLGSSVVSEADQKKTLRYSSRVEIQSGEVSRVKEFFEAKPLDTTTKPTAVVKDDGTIEAGSVHKFTWLFENYPMDTLKDSSEGIQEIPPEKNIKGGDVGGKRFVFETYSLDQIHDKVDETELHKIQKDTMSKANVKSCTMLFESQPLYAIQDKEGGYHEVTSVQKEEIMKGDVKGARWLFETKPLDQIKKEEEVFVIRAVTQEDIKKGDVQAARWRFETEPLDSFPRGKISVPRTVDDVQKGDVQSNKQLFESQQVGQKKYVRMVSVSDVQRGDVRTSTWLFENQPVDSLYGDADRSSSISTVQREDSQKGDVKRCTWLFETQPMDTLKDPEVTVSTGTQEPIPRADVKSTTWLFESTPLDKFSASECSRETELKERTMKETLETLCTCQAIQHDGILIEANDMESVKMVKYQLSSPGAPEILKEEIVRGHLQGIMLQLLHRTNVEPQSVLVEEDREGKIKVSSLQLLDQSEAIKGKEDLSGNVTKALQGLLSQDASIKKGMVIQETKSESVKMTLYSLLFHSVQQKVVKGDVKSTIGNLMASSQEQRATVTVKREDNEKGNVQLFASCIEKGDLDYLKNLQQESEIQSLISAQAEQGAAESAPQVLPGTNTHVLANKEQVEKVMAEAKPGALEGAKKVFAGESTGKEGALEREGVHAVGVTGTTAQCLGKPQNLPTGVEKEEIMSGGLKVTTKSVQRVADVSRNTEKEESISACLKEPKATMQGIAQAKVTAERSKVVGEQQSLMTEQASHKQSEEKALGNDLQAAMQSLRLATAEARNIQHHVQSKLQRNREEVHMACRQQVASKQETKTLQSTIHQQESASTMRENTSTAIRTTTTRVQEASQTHTSVSQKSIASHKKPKSKEVCASCLQPVYSMERVFPDRVCLHHSCFCCKICGKKLSLHNYAALHGMFYCQIHYKQMAGAKSRRERERLEQQPGDDQMHRAATVGRGTQPLDWYSGAENKTKARKKPTSFNVPCSLQLAEQRQELNSRPVFLGNKLRNCWPPSETDGKAGKGTYSWKKPALSWQSHQAAGNSVDRVVLMGQERKTATEAAMKEGSFLPGVTYPEKREQVCSWPKPREQRDGEKALAPGDGDVGNGKRGGQVSQRVTAFQQGKLQLKRGSASASSPVLLEPAKPLPRGLLSFSQAAAQCTNPTNWMFPGDKRGCVLPKTELPVKGNERKVKENEVCGSFSPSTPSEGDTRPAMTDDKPEWTAAIAGDEHNLGEGVNNPQPARVPESLETQNRTNMKQKYRDEGNDPPELKAKHQTPHIPVVPGTPSAAPSSLEPGGLSASPEIAELVSETSKINADELPRKQTTVILEENMQPSSVSHLPGEESTGAEFERTNKTNEVNPTGFLEELSPDHASQENKPEKNIISTLGLPEMTDDHHMSHLQETEPQATYGQLVTNPHSSILVHDVKSPSNDFPVSADMSLKRTGATRPSHDEVNSSKSKDPSEDLLGNIFPISEQPIEKLESSKSTVSSDKYGGHPEGKEKMKLKHSEGSVVDTLRPTDKGKEVRSSQARTEVLGKGFMFGKKPFTALFGSEDKGSTHKKETTQGKPTKHQSALVTLFGHSSEKKQSQQKNPAGSSEQTNNEDKQEKLQGLLSSSSQAKQKASKNDQPPQAEKTVVIPKDIQDSAGGCSDTTEGKETDVLLSAPGTNFSGDDKHQRTELNVHDQPAVGRPVQQPQERCCPSLLPAQENQKEGAISFEGGRNPFYPPPDLTSAVDYSKKNLTGNGNPRVGHPLHQNLLSLDVQNTMIEDEIFSSSSNVGKLPKEAELQLDKMDLLEDYNVFLSAENKRQDFPTTVTPSLDLQNAQTGTPPCFDPNPSKLDQEILAETNAPLVAWDTSSLLFLAGQDEIVTRDPEGSQSCAPLQHFDPQCQAPRAAEGAFGLGPRAEGPTNKYLPMQEGSIPAWYLFTSHASRYSHQNLFDPLSDVSDQTGQDAPAKMERSREISEAEEAHENLSSADPNAFSDGLLKQEFFI